MPRSSLAKKLQPAKKALKRFAHHLQSKLHDLNSCKAVKVIKTNTNRFLAYCSRHFFLPFKKRSLTTPPYRRHRYYNHLHHYPHSSKNQVGNNFLPIYIDHLYEAESSSVQAKNVKAHAERSRGKQVVVDTRVLPRKEEKARESSLSLNTIEDAWREIVAKSPQLRPVDERAEEFICKFRQEIELEKERSNLEFEERLARSA